MPELVTLGWVGSAFAVALLAPRKGRMPLAWFCYGLILGPAMVVMALLVEPTRYGD